MFPVDKASFPLSNIQKFQFSISPFFLGAAAPPFPFPFTAFSLLGKVYPSGQLGEGKGKRGLGGDRTDP
jgi:hypothetical protein